MHLTAMARRARAHRCRQRQPTLRRRLITQATVWLQSRRYVPTASRSNAVSVLEADLCGKAVIFAGTEIELIDRFMRANLRSPMMHRGGEPPLGPSGTADVTRLPRPPLRSTPSLPAQTLVGSPTSFPPSRPPASQVTLRQCQFPCRPREAYDDSQGYFGVVKSISSLEDGPSEVGGGVEGVDSNGVLQKSGQGWANDRGA
ncbi:hypothetical protein CONPUDRAFT_77689 [Coniophora puteana RWD-64-598 SS2]|uniref:Uncharacterized protein n=1 Tax=Coniophora puteana (strain RWD-64-598) TaxID=741705 RepID=A0A5M3M6A8_CONPW|nr:uncharacterized protein CONPUDRAFT_77689 [Coniophora puteana RWD-64-598 SS2]EIW74879.1 hypothetical protein CONPUDRAFT_77689 [Coniophora puteana RWD-64-598 SS2]